MPELPSILDEEFAFFLGYLAGDGFMAKGEDDHRVGVSVAHSSYLMEEMPLLLERLFNVNVHKMQKPNDRSVTFVMDNRAIKEFLALNGLEKQGSREVTVPRLIRQSPQNIVVPSREGMRLFPAIIPRGDIHKLSGGSSPTSLQALLQLHGTRVVEILLDQSDRVIRTVEVDASQARSMEDGR